MSIPKILHFTWKTEDVPGRMGEYLEAWRRTHSDWDIRLWTDATMRVFVAEHYPDFLAIYDAYPHPIQRADSFRYLVLNTLGGVYADLDVEPFRSINGLVDGVDCFVGVEPDEHMGPDRRHSGTPFLLSNAFMGALPGHIYFRTIIDLLPKVAHSPIFLSTGPSLTTGAGVRLARKDRPALVPPALWSPLCDGGKACTSDEKLFRLLGNAFDFVWADRQAFVSHHWLTSWVPWHKRHKWLAKPFHAYHALKWKLRALRRPDLAGLPIRDPLTPYLDQTPKPLMDLPTVSVCIGAGAGEGLTPELASALSALDYPKDKISIDLAAFSGDEAGAAGMAESLKQLKGFAGLNVHFVPLPEVDKNLLPGNRQLVRSAALRNALIDAAGAEAQWVLFVGGDVVAIPPDALKVALSAGYPVVAAATIDAEGQETDPTVFRYTNGGGIRVTWKIRGTDTIASASRGQREFLHDLKAFRLIPLDGVGRGFVLVRRDVLEAGVRFAETPYHLHLDGEGFALMAREEGFEVAGLTDLAVTAS